MVVIGFVYVVFLDKMYWKVLRGGMFESTTMVSDGGIILDGK